MSYARFDANSDVYVYLSGNLDGPVYHCCACELRPGCFDAPERQRMVEHLRAHIHAGHKVPGDAIADLEAGVFR